jgi:hypothetical protein
MSAASMQKYYAALVPETNMHRYRTCRPKHTKAYVQIETVDECRTAVAHRFRCLAARWCVVQVRSPSLLRSDDLQYRQQEAHRTARISRRDHVNEYSAPAEEVLRATVTSRLSSRYWFISRYNMPALLCASSAMVSGAGKSISGRETLFTKFVYRN